ncbi:unnamed protein product [Rotaria sp. Silwood1]|nr:unnamed protein product [Rotaria sp. Silwood1]CAF1170011.1 unnamed protein product [Rotaria sp. Silwood1]CAF1174339.1 unnamed protein product [Rotaria sp. Silwood1]CAF3469731.1 unnamed protein product [Rotaria sp. Silwood1]CAF3473541.1 unnamed protein product [Rotaria sp. Silwood1]
MQMTSSKAYFVLQVLFLTYLLHMSCALECKTCQKDNLDCLSSENIATRHCENDNDLCFSWFDRTGSGIGVQRDCISTNAADYKMIKRLIGGRDSGCVKRCKSKRKKNMSIIRFWLRPLQQSSIRRSSTLNQVIDKRLNPELDSIRQAGTWKAERIISTSQSAHIKVERSTNDLLNFCANNYLGLANNSEIIKAAKNALDEYGAGLSSVRFICGTQTIHKQLEQRIAKFHQREDAILYISCFDANAGIFETLLKEQDYIISDELNHASIIDGIRLSRAKRLRYKHKDMSDLELKLKESFNDKNENIIRLIATDGVFSMDGTIAPLPDIRRLADKYKALIFVDECHATGFFGPTGRGTEEHFGMIGTIDIINSTLGKALGGAAGGYTTGPKALIDLLRQRSRPYLFSNTLPPPIVASAMKAIDLIENDSSLPGRVLENAKYFRTEMQALGFKILGDNHPICPVMLGDARLASQFADEMLKRGIYVIGFSYPVVPKDRARIRVQVSAAHSKADLKRCIDAFAQVGRQLKVIK